MPECERCGAFTDNPAEKEYHYCDSCQSKFEEVCQNGVVIQQSKPNGDYNIFVASENEDYQGGTESSQVDALARAKHLSDKLRMEALFQYKKSGSRWMLEEYLQAHPSIRRDVLDRLSRLPENQDAGFIQKMLGMFSK